VLLPPGQFLKGEGVGVDGTFKGALGITLIPTGRDQEVHILPGLGTDPFT